MLGWALTFLVIAIIAAIFGIAGIAATASSIAQILFVVFLALFLVSVMVAMARGGFVGVPVGAVVAFEKTVALSPDFAPAWFNLASIYALRKETLQKALDAAQQTL